MYALCQSHRRKPLVSTQVCGENKWVYKIETPCLEPRLKKRYRVLVQQHLSKAESVATGLRLLPRTATAFSAAQTAWPFYQNKETNLQGLAEPIIESAKVAAQSKCRNYCLIVNDWSPLHYTYHPSKEERIV